MQSLPIFERLKGHSQNLFILGLMLMAVGLPLSKFLMSLSQFVMGAAWFLEGNFPQKLERLKANWTLLLPFVLIYFSNLVGQTYSANWTYGLHDIKVKLPLIILPFLISTMPSIDLGKRLFLLKLFIAAVFLATLVSLYFYMGFSSKKLNDIREISRFISHIRFGLMICLAVFICLHFYVKQDGKAKYSWIITALYFAGFLFLLQSSTAILMLVVCGLFSVVYYFKYSLSKAIKFSFLGFGIVVLCSVLFLTYHVHHIAFPTPKPFSEQIIKNGRHFYYNDTAYKATENGNYIWINTDVEGLKNGWKIRSQGEIITDDSAGNNRLFVLMRYLTSLGLPKDSEAVVALSDRQVEEVKCNCTNYLFCNKFDPRHRLYETFWEWEDYRIFGNADGHSVVMRLEFLRNAFHILASNPFFGVGTGDVADAFVKSYKETNSSLDLVFQHRSHNQFVTYAIAIGLLGLGVVLVGFYLWLRNLPLDPMLRFPSLIFALILLGSMLNEDTLETQAGVTFMAFFVAIFWKETLKGDS